MSTDRLYKNTQGQQTRQVGNRATGRAGRQEGKEADRHTRREAGIIIIIII